MIRKLLFTGALTVLFTGSVFADVYSPVLTPGALGANDAINFQQLGPDSTTVSSGVALTTNTGRLAHMDVFGGANTALAIRDCPAAPSCSWTGAMGAGDGLVWAFDGTGGSGPLGFRLGGVSGVGAYVQADNPGRFQVSLQWFDLGLFLAGSTTVNSDAAGDPVFIGVTDLSGAGIGAVKFDLTDSTHDFAMDTLLLKVPGAPVPEPASLFLLGGIVAGLGFLKRQKLAGK